MTMTVRIGEQMSAIYMHRRAHTQRWMDQHVAGRRLASCENQAGDADASFAPIVCGTSKVRHSVARPQNHSTAQDSTVQPQQDA